MFFKKACIATSILLAFQSLGYAQQALPDQPLATGKDKFLGNIHSSAQVQDFARLWNQVTPENAGKWGSVERVRDEMNWTQLDAAYQLAKDNGFPFKMHVMVWGSQQPSWIESLGTAEQEAEIIEWYAAVAERYPDIDIVEVVNEPLHAAPEGAGRGNYIEALGGSGTTGWDWIIRSFELARTYFPNSTLMINEYGILGNNSAANQYSDIVNLLKERDLIDGVGMQAHAFSTRGSTADIAESLQIVANTGIDVYITELDVDGPTDEQQLVDYQRLLTLFWEHEAVKGITLWGWRPGLWRDEQDAELITEDGTIRPALAWMIEYISNVVPTVIADQEFNIGENAVVGTQVGLVVAQDDNGDDIVSYQIEGDAGPFTIDTNGAITVANSQSLDYETTTQYTLNITASDDNATSEPVPVSILVTDENDVPVVTAEQTFTVAENAAEGTVVGTVLATDLEGDVLGNWQSSDARFSISSSGELTVAANAALDFETTATISVDIQVSDAMGPSQPQAVTIELQNVNEAPTVISGQTLTVAENRTQVGQVQASDPESTDLTYALAASSTLFQISSDGAITVQSGQSLDYETATSHTLSVTVSDGEFESDPIDVTVRVTDINENPSNGSSASSGGGGSFGWMLLAPAIMAILRRKNRS